MPCPLFSTQQEVTRGSWAHCIEDIGTVRNQELCMEMGTRMGGLKVWELYHSNGFSHTQPLPNHYPGKLSLL